MLVPLCSLCALDLIVSHTSKGKRHWYARTTIIITDGIFNAGFLKDNHIVSKVNSPVKVR